ncbi:uncharacterized protein PHALS_14929 [Plasmopara halstedii]|uniref:Uncharacterized protein n=1 Tax=Plasmopara halstedii TaxID=4781 RepID=A0A0N7L7D0_PLAHL|nr:uncharacterized protein PHALS_14929 [Plasmopara halstedii]CEG46731.1 hypothetical protein PHALS_14929 [Plasmopara halstedii]|eukprot:XP_024583100.1 hypothetical protein PHALS_14929 [Plasmopara halstedii]
MLPMFYMTYVISTLFYYTQVNALSLLGQTATPQSLRGFANLFVVSCGQTTLPRASDTALAYRGFSKRLNSVTTATGRTIVEGAVYHLRSHYFAKSNDHVKFYRENLKMHHNH